MGKSLGAAWALRKIALSGIALIMLTAPVHAEPLSGGQSRLGITEGDANSGVNAFSVDALSLIGLDSDRQSENASTFGSHTVVYHQLGARVLLPTNVSQRLYVAFNVL